ncbi:MAG: hypothetical protein M0P57_07695 [Syntrophales bacterium]|jgi:RHS repeat-associated protein|nr:hypothetical protein [Syntrophales bacterium]
MDTIQWQHDPEGNWTYTNQNGNQESRTANGVNEYTNIAGFEPSYDDRGNMTRDASKRYEYDWANRLVAVKGLSGSVIATYTYDALNRRVTKSYGGHTTAYIYDGGQVIEEYEDSQFQRSFVYGLYIDDPIMMEDDAGNRYYYLKDRQYSMTALTDENGNIVETYEYTAFGLMTILDGQGVMIGESTVDNPYGYTGRRWDGESGLWYYRSRMYSAKLGRFMQCDPAGYVDGLNLYAYVRNNPLRYLDPEGLTAVSGKFDPTDFTTNMMGEIYKGPEMFKSLWQLYDPCYAPSEEAASADGMYNSWIVMDDEGSVINKLFHLLIGERRRSGAVIEAHKQKILIGLEIYGEPGDLLFGSGREFISLMIKWATTSTVNHVGMYQGDNSLSESYGSAGGQFVNVSDFAKRYDDIFWVRPLLGGKEAAGIQSELILSPAGLRYNIWGLFGLFNQSLNHGAICSELQWHTFSNIGYLLPGVERDVRISPADLYDARNIWGVDFEP